VEGVGPPNASVQFSSTASRFNVGAPGQATTEWATRLEAIEAYEWILTERLLEAVGDRVHLHASGCVAHGGAILVLGSGGAGKSSIAFGWHRLGIPVLGDDIVLLEAGGRAAPFRRLFKLDPMLLSEAGIVVEETPGWEAGSAEAWFEPSERGSWAEPAQVRVVAIVRHVGGTDLAVRDLSKAHGLSALAASVVSSGRSKVEGYDLLVDAIRGARVVDLTFGSAAAATRRSTRQTCLHERECHTR
jgi:hypothetical protein